MQQLDRLKAIHERDQREAEALAYHVWGWHSDETIGYYDVATSLDDAISLMRDFHRFYAYMGVQHCGETLAHIRGGSLVIHE